MNRSIPVAHDFNCPWCWVGLFQAQRLQREFGIEIEWLGFELMPKGMKNEPTSPTVDPPNRPATLSRLSFLLVAENMALPLVPKPPDVRTYNAHQAVEYAKTEGVQDALVEAIYRAYWEDGRDINKISTLCEIANGIVSDTVKMKLAMEGDQFGSHIVDFDEDAYAVGVYNVPTFFIGEKRLAEQPYSVIRKAMVDLIGSEPETTLYKEIAFKNHHFDRPYTYINMVSTIDGKIITGERNESVHDLGSDIDHFLMRRLETKADAVLAGANSLRASGVTWNPKTHARIVVTKSGDVPWDSQFLTNGDAIVLTTQDSDFEPIDSVTVIKAGKTELDWKDALRQLLDRGIKVINVLGGSEINAQLLERELIDEIFMTLAPKIKLGSDTPTIAGGIPLKREDVQKFNLVSNEAIGDEIFLRYRK